MAKPSFSLKQPMNKKDQRVALMGWSVGALVAVGAYVGAVQFLPSSPSGSMIASLQNQGVDPIFTGSIGNPSGQMRPQGTLPFGSPLQAQIDDLTLQIAELKDAVSATQAATRSTNRRMELMETGSGLTTASVNATDTGNSEQPLPRSLEPLSIAQPEPRVILPAPIPVDGGAISISQRPLLVDGDTQPMNTDEMMANDATQANEGAAVLSQTPFAIDVGGAETLADIDALWLAHRQAYGDALADLSPRILLQQTSAGALDLRLVAGPIDDAADAALLCARLVAAGLERCLPAVFDGQRLALR